MRVPQSWLTEVVHRASPGWAVSTDELDTGFVDVGFEIESVEPLGPVTGPVVVGRVESIEELTEFKKPIRFCSVQVGEESARGIVCGATNFAVGDLIVAALPGSVLPGNFAIAARKTYGRVSDGMICSASELGIGTDHSGILVLPPNTATPGADAGAVLGLDDTVFDINVTPDRGYALSVRGLARELACGFDLEFADPADRPTASGSTRSNEAIVRGVELTEGCGATRFALRSVIGVDPHAVTPWWIARRLLLCGIRPISPAVDVTNYVMLELGHPLHAFDSARVDGDLVVRRAMAGEQLVTLDGVTRTLDLDDVVIADSTGAISLAGVMGGASSEVTASTTEVLLEAAVWDPIAIFRTARRHKLSSEASRRFERIVDPALAVRALDRAATLLAEIAGGRVERALTDVVTLGHVHARPAVTIEIDLPDRVAGVEYPNGTAARRLKQIGCHVAVVAGEDGHGRLVVTPPTWRPDMSQPADLVEEVLRLEGLERIPSTLPSAPPGRGLTPVQMRRRAIGRALAHSGHVEVLAPVFLPAGIFDVWGLAADDPRRNTARVLNPLEADRPELASTLLPGVLEVLARNVARGQRDVSLFSVAQVVLPHDRTAAVDALPVDRRPSDEQVAELKNSLPNQPVHVCAVYTGLRDPAGPWGPGRLAEASDAFAAVHTIAHVSGVDVELRAGRHDPWHPGRCAQVLVNGTVVGWAGELHPAMLERAGLPPRTCALELDLDAVPVTQVLPSPAVSAFPAVLQDVAVVVDAAVPAADVEAALRGGAGELLEQIRLFDVFIGSQVGEGRKSLAYALRFRATDRTLTEDEASAARDAAVAAAHRSVGASLRS